MSPLLFQYCVNQDASPFRQPTWVRIFGIEPSLLPCEAGEGDHEVVEGARGICGRAAPPQSLRDSAPARGGAAV